MIRALVLLLAIGSAFAAEPWPAGCREDRLPQCLRAWEPADDLADTYYVYRQDAVLCGVLTATEHPRADGTVLTLPPATRWSPYASPLCWLAETERATYYVVACNAAGCSEWSEGVEFVGQPFACFEPCGETPCYEGAERRFPEMAQCPETEWERARREEGL